MSTCLADGGFEKFGCICGSFAAFVYFFVQIPQIIKNYKRKTTSGFSIYYVIIRLIGTSFFFVNSSIKKLAWPIILSGVLLYISFGFLLVQHAFYEYSRPHYFFLLVIVFPIAFGLAYPASIKITDFINPIFQIVAYIPFINECLKAKTTSGVSLLSFHINFLGSVLGILMCTITDQCDSTGWFLHIISMCQSAAIYMIAIEFNEFNFIDNYKQEVQSTFSRLNY